MLGAGSLPVVILDAQDHPAAGRTRDTPGVDGVDQVTQVKIAGGGRSEPCRAALGQRIPWRMRRTVPDGAPKTLDSPVERGARQGPGGGSRRVAGAALARRHRGARWSDVMQPSAIPDPVA